MTMFIDYKVREKIHIFQMGRGVNCNYKTTDETD